MRSRDYPLISPPPHHDIYSIEDLAQLIYDLRQVNRRAKIGVKLVAEAGVGTIAAGVAKARADYILISGHSGGTGASPLASIKHAGCPWELGFAETQQTLVMNGLRSRVRLRTDGGIKTPEDVIKAAMLGAEEYGFGTSVLVAIGCDMARQCHLNTCPTGIATQKPELRAKFTGTPEMVANYFTLLAEGVRVLLAELGVRSLEELVGRSDLLSQKPRSWWPRRSPRSRRHFLPSRPLPKLAGKPSTLLPVRQQSTTICSRPMETRFVVQGASKSIARLQPLTEPSALRSLGKSRCITVSIRSMGRAVDLTFSGSAGQSFGAFTVDGMTLRLIGEANDYVGKGMAGGTIAVKPMPDAAFSDVQVIAGNTILYGATGGEVFLAGKAGERFAVRNSGATAVVEGVGDHGCEYMTGGTVVVLGNYWPKFRRGYDQRNGLCLRSERRVRHKDQWRIDPGRTRTR